MRQPSSAAGSPSSLSECYCPEVDTNACIRACGDPLRVGGGPSAHIRRQNTIPNIEKANVYASLPLWQTAQNQRSTVWKPAPEPFMRMKTSPVQAILACVAILGSAA